MNLKLSSSATNGTVAVPLRIPILEFLEVVSRLQISNAFNTCRLALFSGYGYLFVGRRSDILNWASKNPYTVPFGDDPEIT